MKATSITMYDVAIGLYLPMGTTFLTCIFTAKFLYLAIFENNREADFSIWSSLLLCSYLYCEFEFINKNVHSLYFASNKVKRCYIFR